MKLFNQLIALKILRVKMISFRANLIESIIVAE